MHSLRLHRIAWAVSVAVNLLLIVAIALYIHFAGLIDAVAEAVGFFD